jgi:hypothetical protein
MVSAALGGFAVGLALRGALGPDGGVSATPPVSSQLTPLEIEERTDKIADRREKLDYFYISASVAILVFTFNNFNAKNGILQQAPLWLVEAGWGALILAAICPLYVMRLRLDRFAMRMDELSGLPVKDRDRARIKRLRARRTWAERVMTFLFLIGIAVLALTYGLGFANSSNT